MLAAGTLRNRITLFVQQTTTNSGGERLTEWVEYKKLWANFTHLSERELRQSGATDNQTIARCIVRYIKDITSGMQIVYDGRRYTIVGQPILDPKTGREYLTLALASVPNV